MKINPNKRIEIENLLADLQEAINLLDNKLVKQFSLISEARKTHIKLIYEFWKMLLDDNYSKNAEEYANAIANRQEFRHLSDSTIFKVAYTYKTYLKGGK